MRRRVFLMFGLIYILVITACATTTGKQISDQDVSKIKRGKTTYSEVIQILGQPSTKKSTKDGTILVYQFAEARSDVLSYVPYTGGLLGTTDTKYKNVNVFLDKNNIVREVQVEEGASESGQTL